MIKIDSNVQKNKKRFFSKNIGGDIMAKIIINDLAKEEIITKGDMQHVIGGKPPLRDDSKKTNNKKIKVTDPVIPTSMIYQPPDDDIIPPDEVLPGYDEWE